MGLGGSVARAGREAGKSEVIRWIGYTRAMVVEKGQC